MSAGPVPTRLAPTPSQTVGPYFGFALPWFKYPTGAGSG